jgi:hypothetical protein
MLKTAARRQVGARSEKSGLEIRPEGERRTCPDSQFES